MTNQARSDSDINQFIADNWFDLLGSDSATCCVSEGATFRVSDSASMYIERPINVIELPLPTDDQLSEIYKTANDEVGKARPLTTERIFAAMRAAIEYDRTLRNNNVG